MTTTKQQIIQFPPGWKLVPITPTKRMIKAADSACRNACNEYADYYNAMINASLEFTPIDNDSYGDGVSLVPTNPTKLMIDKAEALDWGNEDIRGNVINMYNIMIHYSPYSAVTLLSPTLVTGGHK